MPDDPGDDGASGDDSDRVEPGADRPEWDVAVNAEAPVTVGDSVRFGKTLSDDDVERFAAASGDTNPLPLDDEWAVDTRFGGPIVHGAPVAGLISAALARFPGTVIYRAQDLEFLAPVRVGDRGHRGRDARRRSLPAPDHGRPGRDPHRHRRGRGAHRRHARVSHLLPAGGDGGRFRRRLTAARSEDSSASRSSGSTASSPS
jgi:hypothetical protein